MVKRPGLLIIWLFSLLTLCGQCLGNGLTILTLEEPPGSFTNASGHLTGISVDVVREIQKRIGSTAPIKVLPWARTYQTAVNSPNVVAFTMARTWERENKFHWITKVTRNRYSFFMRKDGARDIAALDDLKRLRAVGVVRSSVWEESLKAEGFENLDPVATHELNLKKLLAGRVPAIYFSSVGLMNLCGRHILDCTAIDPVFTTRTVESHIIMSKNGTPMAVVNQWKKAAAEIKKDGTFERLAGKWVHQMGLKGAPPHYADGALNFWQKETAPPSLLPVKEVISTSPSWDRFTNKDGTGLYHGILNRIFSPSGIRVTHKYTIAKRGIYLVRQGLADMYTCKSQNDDIPGLLMGGPPMYQGRVYTIFKNSRVLDWKGRASLAGRKVVWRHGYYKLSELPAGIIPVEAYSGESALGQVYRDRADFYVDDLNLIQETLAKTEFPVKKEDFRIEPIGMRSYHPVFNNSSRGQTLLMLYEKGMARLHRSGELKDIFDKWGMPYPEY